MTNTKALNNLIETVNRMESPDAVLDATAAFGRTVRLTLARVLGAIWYWLGAVARAIRHPMMFEETRAQLAQCAHELNAEQRRADDPENAEIQRRKHYWAEVRSTARAVEDVAEELTADGYRDDDFQDKLIERVDEMIDGDPQVIYTFRAIETLLYSDNDSAVEEFGSDCLVSDGQVNWSLMAYCAFRADVLEMVNLSELTPICDDCGETLTDPDTEVKTDEDCILCEDCAPKPEIEGTVSHGTMREEDLIPAFLDALEECGSPDAQLLREEWQLADVQMVSDEYGTHFDFRNDDESEYVSDFVNETLFDALNDCAPEGWFFGAHPGDGSDYGFWRNEEC